MARSSNERKPATRLSISSFHFPFIRDANGLCSILDAAEGGAFTNVGVSVKRTDSVCSLLTSHGQWVDREEVSG